MRVLVGNTGLIGKTLKDSMQFDLEFNSSNMVYFNSSVEDGSDLYLCCLPATMWQVNKNLPRDINNLTKVIKNLQRKKYRNIVLFSSIEVYNQSPQGSDESNTPTFNKAIYGSNRYLFEMLVKTCLEFDNLKILRLPALFGKHLKKNVFFDLMNDNEVNKINTESCYQWYNLGNLVSDIEKSYQYDTQEINFFGEPINTSEIVNDIFRMKISNDMGSKEQNFKTKFTESGYWLSKQETLDQMGEFLDENWS
jgi:hypothetical protein